MYTPVRHGNLKPVDRDEPGTLIKHCSHCPGIQPASTSPNRCSNSTNQGSSLSHTVAKPYHAGLLGFTRWSYTTIDCKSNGDAPDVPGISRHWFRLEVRLSKPLKPVYNPSYQCNGVRIYDKKSHLLQMYNLLGIKNYFEKSRR